VNWTGGRMKIVLISCSNVLNKRDTSISTRIGEIAGKIASRQKEGVLTETLRLCDYKLVTGVAAQTAQLFTEVIGVGCSWAG